MKLLPARRGAGAKAAGPGARPNAKKSNILLGVQGQLILFLGGITLVTLLLVWVLITYFLQPQYTRTMRTSLENKLGSIVTRIDASDTPLVTYSLWGTKTANADFWQSFYKDIEDGALDVDNTCIDISDRTCRSIQYIENLYPCILHESMGALSGLATTYSDTRIAILLRQQLFDDGSLYQIVESGGNRQMVVGGLSADGNYAVIVSTSLAQIETAATVLTKMLPPIGLGILVLVVLFAVVFSRWFTRPVRQLSAGAREMAEGNYDVHVDVRRKDELGLLAQEFNHMAGEVKRSAQLERDILANVSHDLRTPLTLIKGYAETVRDITGDDAERRAEQCNIIVDETDRLSALVNSVMELSKVSSGAEKPNLVTFDMSQLCFEVAGRYDAVCDQNGWTLQLEADHECIVQADPDMMERVLHNLLGNATHHMGQDGIFILRCIPLHAGGCRVEVEDHGPGILPEDLPHVFDRYYRSRKDQGKVGSGLGLSITKAILQQHGFAFGVNSIPGHGATFWFEMQDTRAGKKE